MSQLTLLFGAAAVAFINHSVFSPMVKIAAFQAVDPCSIHGSRKQKRNWKQPRLKSHFVLPTPACMHACIIHRSLQVVFELDSQNKQKCTLDFVMMSERVILDELQKEKLVCFACNSQGYRAVSHHSTR